MLVIGTSVSSKPGHRPSNMCRLTTPCSWETPLARCAEAQAHDGHVEDARLAAGVVLGAEREQPLDRDAVDGVVAAEVDLDLVGVEAVDAGGHRACAW